MELHPSPTSRVDNVPTDAITKGRHADLGAFPASKEVWCAQCGFRCNLDRDARNLSEFGETIGKGFKITDHGYRTRAQIDSGDSYEGDERVTSNLSVELSNGSFENWTAGSPNNWTLSGTVTQITTAGFFDKSDDGSNSARITRSGSNISLSQSVATPSDFNSETIIFRVRVKSSTNGIVRLRVDVNSTSYYSSYNIAQQNFQELSILVKCPATVSALTVVILADNANGTAYIDQAVLMRYGNPTTVSINSGCPHCGSSSYFSPPEPL